MGHPGQGVRKRFWGKIPDFRNFMELKIYETRGRRKKLRECGNGDPSQVESTEAWAPPKSAGKSQPHVISEKNKFF